jgi:hypothetical protein
VEAISYFDRELPETQLMSGLIDEKTRKELAVVLGGKVVPTLVTSGYAEGTLMISQMLEEYERINASVLAKKSPQQFKKWKVRRQSAIDLFISVIGGDRPFANLARQDTQALRRYWQDRINAGDVRVNSANRQIRQFSGLYRTLKDYMQLDGTDIFHKLRIPGGEDGRTCFSQSGHAQGLPEIHKPSIPKSLAWGAWPS